MRNKKQILGFLGVSVSLVVLIAAAVSYAMESVQEKNVIFPQHWVGVDDLNEFSNLTYSKHILRNLKDPYKNEEYVLLQSTGSTSMAPAYGGNCSYIIKQDVTIKDIEVGDVVAYHSNEGSILHRVIKKYDTHLITKGDNNDSDDLSLFGFSVTNENIIGVLVGVIY